MPKIDWGESGRTLLIRPSGTICRPNTRRNMEQNSDDTCPGCDERQWRASTLIEYLENTPAPANGWQEALEAARYYLEDQ